MSLDSYRDTLKQRLDITEVIGRFVPLKKAGRSYKACCPFHQEKTPSFHVNAEKQTFYCFGCHKGGDLIRFVEEHERVDYVGALRLLGQMANIPFPEERHAASGPADPSTKREVLLELHEKLTGWFQQNLLSEVGAEAREYLDKRAMDAESIQRFRLGFAPDGFGHARDFLKRLGYSLETQFVAGVLAKKEEDPTDRAYDRFRLRLIFPIWNEHGQVVAFSGRVLRPEQAGGKYINSPETPLFHKGRVLYALPLAREAIRESRTAIICEGPMDVIACHRAGILNAVAPQGTAFTPEQASLLKRYADKLILAFDADNAGLQAARRAAEVFIPAGLQAEVVSLLDDQDPDSILRQHGSETLRGCFAQTRDYFDWLVESEMLAHPTKDAEAKVVVARKVLEAVALLGSPVARASKCQLLAARLQVPEGAVMQELRALTARQARQRPGQQTAIALPTPTTLSLTRDPRQQVEATLLDLALHHESCAQQLLAHCPPESLSEGPVGRLLNALLAMTAEGEWSQAQTLLQESFPGEGALMRPLTSPDYPAGTDPATVAKALRQCLERLVALHREEQRRHIQQQLKTAPADQRAALLGQLQELMRPPRPVL